MREKLIELLGLKPADVTNEVADDQIVAAVAGLKRQSDAAAEASKNEKAIRDLVAESFGALNREQAKQILAERASRAGKQNG
jgi:hypothetical protein